MLTVNKLIHAFTTPGADMPPYINISRIDNGSVRVIIRGHPFHGSGTEEITLSEADWRSLAWSVFTETNDREKQPPALNLSGLAAARAARGPSSEGDYAEEMVRAYLGAAPAPQGMVVAYQWRKRERTMKHDEVWSYADYFTGMKIAEHPEKYEVRALGVIADPVHWLDSTDSGAIPAEIGYSIGQAKRIASSAERFIAAVIAAEGDDWRRADDEGELLLCYDGEDGDGYFDVHAAMAAAIGAPDQRWRDMSTAPRDGTHILVKFDGTTSPPTVAHWFGPADLPGLRSGGWYLSVQQLEGPAIYPTHWRPLP